MGVESVWKQLLYIPVKIKKKIQTNLEISDNKKFVTVC